MNELNIYSINDISDLFKAKGIKPSIQRLSVLRYIIQHKNHPSVDTIYKALSPEIPTLSKTTIYNTLDQLVEKGIVTALTISDNEVRYDFILSDHPHFLCSVCGKIYDVNSDADFSNGDFVDGHKIDEIQLHYKGTCRGCLNQ